MPYYLYTQVRDHDRFIKNRSEDLEAEAAAAIGLHARGGGPQSVTELPRSFFPEPLETDACLVTEKNVYVAEVKFELGDSAVPQLKRRTDFVSCAPGCHLRAKESPATANWVDTTRPRADLERMHCRGRASAQCGPFASARSAFLDCEAFPLNGNASSTLCLHAFGPRFSKDERVSGKRVVGVLVGEQLGEGASLEQWQDDGILVFTRGGNGALTPLNPCG